MRASLKIFGSVLNQVVHQIDTQRGASAVLRTARVLSAGLALSAAAAGVQAQTGSYDDNRSGPSVAAPSAESEAAAAKLQEMKNTGARLFGGALGALGAAKLTEGAGVLWKTTATLGGAYLGQAAGNAIVPAANAPTGQKVSSAAITGNASYDRALAVSFSPSLASTPKSLPPSIHMNLAGLMTATMASRQIAVRALRDFDVKELAMVAAPRNAALATESQAAGRQYSAAFTSYISAHRDAWNVINLAQSKGLDVTAQRTLMDSMPSDLRKPTTQSVEWPGVAAKVAELGGRSLTAKSYADMVAEMPLASMPQRQR